jgi:hypothetical protein
MSPRFDQLATALLPMTEPDVVRLLHVTVPVSVGEMLNTLFPVPVISIAPVPPSVFDSAPVEMLVAFRFDNPGPLPPIVPVAVRLLHVTNPVKKGEPLNTLFPEPVVSIAPVPPSALASVPEEMLVAFRPVRFEPMPLNVFAVMEPAVVHCDIAFVDTKFFPIIVSFDPTAR